MTQNPTDTNWESLIERDELVHLCELLQDGFAQPDTPQGGFVDAIVTAERADTRLTRTLASLWTQTLKPTRILIVWTGPHIPSLTPTELNVDHLHLRGGWISHALNLGLKQVEAQMVVPLISGDELLPDALERMAWALRRYDVDAVCPSQETGGRADPLDPDWQPRRLLTENPYGRHILWRTEAARLSGGFGDFDDADQAGWKLLIGLAEWGGSLMRLPLKLFVNPLAPMSRAPRGFWPEALGLSLQKLPDRPDVVPVHFPFPFTPPVAREKLSLNADAAWDVSPDARTAMVALPDLDDTMLTARVLESVHALAEQGWRFVVVTSRESEHLLTDRFAPDSVAIVHLAHATDPSDYLALCAHLIGSRQVDMLFIANCDWAYNAAPLLKRLFPAMPIVDYVTRTGPHDDVWLRIGASNDVVLSASLFSSNWLKTRGETHFGREHGRRIVQTLNADCERVSPENIVRGELRREDELEEDAFVIAYATPLTEHHKPLRFVNIVAGLLNRGLSRPLRVWVLGEGPELDEMHRRIRRHELGEFFRFWPPETSRLSLLRNADVLVLTGVSHDISPPTFEAMALGLPVVSIDACGQREAIGEAGVLVTPGEFEVADYVQAIGELMAQPGRRFSLGLSARKRAQINLDVASRHKAIGDAFDTALKEIAATPPQTHEPDWVEPACDRYRLWVRSEQLRRMWKPHETRCEPLHEELLLWHRFMPLTRLFPRGRRLLKRAGLFGGRKRGPKKR